MAKKDWDFWKWSVGISAVILLGLFWYFVIGISANQPGSYYNKGHNAVWLGHKWVGEQKSETEIRELVENLSRHQVDTVFVHSGPLAEDGNIDPLLYEYAPYFLEVARQFNSEIEYQAWLGQRRSDIGLAFKDVKENVAKQAMIMTQLVGFDGVHYDIEPVWDKDPHFVEVLKLTKEKIPNDKKISVALAEFIPGSFVWAVEGVHKFENYNTEENYQNVAKYADQIVPMIYDTGLADERLYRWLVKEQVIWLTDLLQGKEVIVGIPAYDDGTPDSDAKIENVENALLGVIDGLNNIRSDEDNFGGIAIYSYWEMDDDEWEIYDKYWLNNEL